MKFGVGIDYALKALVFLAERHPAGQPLRVEEIAGSQSIPENYLRHLLIELKRGGLVVSQKGPSGGYMLGRDPGRVTVLEVVEILGGQYVPIGCLEDGAEALCRKDEGCPLRPVWSEVRDAVSAVLKRHTLQSLAEGRRTGLHYYI